MPITDKEGTVTYSGLVLAFGITVDSLFERDEYWAIVWDEASKEDRRVSTGGRQWGQGWGVDRDLVTVDATPEVRNAFYNLTVKRAIAHELNTDLHGAMSFEIGRQVAVVKGRKVKIGSKGTILSSAVDSYKSSRYHTEFRLQLRLEDGSIAWTAQENCQVFEPWEMLAGWDEILRRAHQSAQETLTKLMWEVTHAGR